MKTIYKLLLALATTFFLVLPAQALDLQQAKNQGLVGELATGYLGSPQGSPSADVKSLIADINAKRKAKYAEIAQSQGITLEAVEKLAGKKAFEKTESGHYVNVPGVGWQKK